MVKGKAAIKGKKSAKTDAGARLSQGARVPEPLAPTATTGAPPSYRPDGQRLWDMPYSTTAPRLINHDLGLHNIVARAGHNAGYDIDLTLLDAPDHRMIRSGVVLAHRVLDGRGEWYLGASDWVPLLPKELIEPMGQGDLPEELADLVRPFRRRATLGPVAALRCERREFALRDDRGNTMGLLRDDKVTVRRGGLTTARYREVMITPIGPGLSYEQDLWLQQAFGLVGGTPVSRFPRLVNRLGAPANGLSDFPPIVPFDATTGFAQFVASLLAARLRHLLEADLGVRADQPDTAQRMAEHATRLRRELGGLSQVLDPGWVEDLEEELEWLAGLAAEPATLKQRLRSERYLTLLERLVTATRAPKVGDSTSVPAGEVVEALFGTVRQRLDATVGELTPQSPPEDWEAAKIAVDDTDLVSEVADLLGLGPGKAVDRLHAVAERLASTAALGQRAQATRELAAESSPVEAFELGRRYEHELDAAKQARTDFVAFWGKTAKKLLR